MFADARNYTGVLVCNLGRLSEGARHRYPFRLDQEACTQVQIPAATSPEIYKDHHRSDAGAEGQKSVVLRHLNRSR
nr:hypothetical protein CFP56_34673 [Quercus suber]